MSQSKHTIKSLFTSSSLRIASAGRLLSENRTGTNPYVSTYSYTNRGQRATAFRSEKGVASHNGTYSYDAAGRLTNVADTVSGSLLNGNYSWDSGSQLVGLPGSGYSVNASYDEESRLTSLGRTVQNTTTTNYTYGYGFDGGKRWRKDLIGNKWDWYPCGVACCAGELGTLTSNLTGATWQAETTNLSDRQTTGSVGQTALQSLGSTFVYVGNSGQEIARNVVDNFGEFRSASGSHQYTRRFQAAQEQYRLYQAKNLSKAAATRPGRMIIGSGITGSIDFVWAPDCFSDAIGSINVGTALTGCLAGIVGNKLACYAALAAAIVNCVMFPPLCTAGLQAAAAVCGFDWKKCLLGVAGAIANVLWGEYTMCLKYRYGIKDPVKVIPPDWWMF